VFHLDFPACPEQEVSTTRSRAGSAAGSVVVYASDNKNAESICAMLLAHGIHCAAAVFDDDPAQEIASAFILSAIIDLSFSQKKFGALLRRLHKSPIATRFTLIFISVDPAVRDHFYVAQAPHLLPWISRRAEIQWGSGAPASALKPWLPGGRKILHVEGNRHVVAFVRQALQVEFSIVSAPTGEHAREYLAHDRFDLVILNLELSVGLVCDVLPATAKEPDQIVPLVILTAQEMSLDALSESEMVQSAPPGNLKALVESVRSLLCIAATDS
jgi:CheY-like chemotaxis protein